MLGAVSVANVLVDRVAPVDRAHSRRIARHCEQETGESLLKRIWSGFCRAALRTVSLLPTRSLRVPGLEAEIARLREVSPHLLADIGIDPVTGAPIQPVAVDPGPVREAEPAVSREAPRPVPKPRAGRPMLKRVSRPANLRSGIVGRPRRQDALR